MLSRFDLGIHLAYGRTWTAVGMLLVSGVLTSCSTVPDAVNPVEWYKSAADLVSGSDSGAEEAAPAAASTEGADKTAADAPRKEPAKGLPADKNNAQYASPVQRQVNPTKPLARRAPPPAAETTQVAQAAPPATPAKPAPVVQAAPTAPAPTVTAAAPTTVAAAPPAAPAAKPVQVIQAPTAPVVPPKPAVTAQELPPVPAPQTAAAPAPRLSPDQRTAVARDDGPAAPPAGIAMTPPPAADIPETVSAPQRGPRRLQEQFQRRLAESAQQTVQSGMVASAGGASYRANEEEPIHLIPPSSQRSRKGGGKGMAAPEPEVPAASFQVAAVDFRAGSSELTSADRQAVAEVARLYKQTGGVVRVVGFAPTSLAGGDAVDSMMDGLEASMKRANAVARELTKRGVPARKIMVGADPAAGSGGMGAQVYIDVM